MKDQDIYTIANPPTSFDFPSLRKKDLDLYYSWFMASMDERITGLSTIVRSTVGFENWSPDYSPDSLKALGKWFQVQIETRRRTTDEINAIYDNSPDWFRAVDVEANELTNKTFSIAMDVGMYFGQVVIRSCTGARWCQHATGTKRDVNFGHVVIRTPTCKVELNPVQLMIVLAYSWAANEHDADRLSHLYYIWRDKLGC